jgi:hypothetical protein
MIKRLILALLIMLFATVYLVVAQGYMEANAQQQPVPTLKPSRITADYQRLTAQPRTPIRGWQVFKGATECVQTGGKLTCDNGYSMQVRP